MSFVDSTLRIAEDLYDGFRGWSKRDHTQYYPVACPHNNNVLALYNGSLVSVISIKGYMGQYFPDQFNGLRNAWVQFMQTSAADKTAAGFDLFWTYEFDPDGMREEVVKSRRAMIEAGKRRGLATEDILLEETEVYGKSCAREQQFLLVVTHLDSLPKTDRIRGLNDRKQSIMGFRRGRDAMNYKVGVDAIEAIHEQQLNKVMTFLSVSRGAKQRYAFERLDCRQALKAMRASLIPAGTSPGWEPRISPRDILYRSTHNVPENVRALQRADSEPNDWTFKLPPKLSKQMLEDVLDLGKYAIIGERAYAPMHVTECATRPEHLETLIDMCYKRRLPIRLSYSLMANSSQANYWNRLFAGFVSFASPSNRQISKADSALRQYAEQGGAVLGYGLAATTWSDYTVSFDAKTGSPRYEVPNLIKRARDVETLLQQWGGQQVDTLFGCAVESTMSATAGYTMPPVCPKSPQPEFDCITQLPLMRPASLWDPRYSIWFRTRDGVLLPYQPLSKLQNAMLTLISGGMGFGKSNLISEHYFYFANHPLAQSMPYVRGIDFGGSAAGVIDLIRESLPDSRKHEAMFRTFVNDPSMIKNIFDTRLGARYPLADHLGFLMRTLSVVCASVATPELMVVVMDILRAAVDIAYAKKDFRRRGNAAQVYKKNLADQLVVDALERIEFTSDDTPYYWEVVDALASKGIETNDQSLIYAAKVAQRHAVPQLKDIVTALDSLADRYVEAVTEQNKSITSQLILCLNAAIGQFPCMVGITNIDISEARACVFDMTNVFGREDTPYDNWRRSIFFSVALRLQTEDMFVNVADTGGELTQRQEELGLSDKILAYHHMFLENQAQVDKVLLADEVHRIGAVKGALDIIDSIGLEGRKYQVGIVLGTQIPEHFPKNVLQLASTFFVCGVSQSMKAAQSVQELLGLTDDERNALYEITKPTIEKGAEIFAVFKTVSGVQRLSLHFQMGGIKRWAYATEADERMLRGILYRKGPSTAWARKTLAAHVPDLQAAVKKKMDAANGVPISRQEAVEQIAAEQLRRLEAAA